jgi:hypothetical protein
MHQIVWNYIAYFAAATVVILVALRTLRDRAARDRAAFERSVLGTARVLKVGNTTPSRSYNATVMDLLIQVQRPGVEPYTLSTIWTVEPSAVPKVQPGGTFAVKVDPLDRTRIYSAESWAKSLGVMKNPIT